MTFVGERFQADGTYYLSTLNSSSIRDALWPELNANLSASEASTAVEVRVQLLKGVRFALNGKFGHELHGLVSLTTGFRL